MQAPIRDDRVVLTEEGWMDLAEEAGQLREAMATRPTIDLAKGIVMAVRGCSPDVAFDVLREASTRHNVKLVRLSDALVRAVQARADGESVGDGNGSLADDVAAQMLVELGFGPDRLGSAEEDELAQRRPRRALR
jgi:hypothetical protein